MFMIVYVFMYRYMYYSTTAWEHVIMRAMPILTVYGLRCYDVFNVCSVFSDLCLV